MKAPLIALALSLTALPALAESPHPNPTGLLIARSFGHEGDSLVDTAGRLPNPNATCLSSDLDAAECREAIDREMKAMDFLETLFEEEVVHWYAVIPGIVRSSDRSTFDYILERMGELERGLDAMDEQGITLGVNTHLYDVEPLKSRLEIALPAMKTRASAVNAFARNGAAYMGAQEIERTFRDKNE